MSKAMDNNDYVGINWKTSTPYAYIGRKHWNLKENGLSQSVIETLIKISDDFVKEVQKEQSDLKIFQLKNKAAKQILDLTLEKFAWNKVANDGAVGPANLFALCGEVKSFLELGGKPGQQRLQTQLDLIRTPSSNISQKQKK